MKIENDYEWDAEQAFDVPYRPVPFRHVPFRSREYTSPSTYGGPRPDRYRGERRSGVGPGIPARMISKIRAELAKEDQGWSAVLLLLACCTIVANAAFAAFGWPLG